MRGPLHVHSFRSPAPAELVKAYAPTDKLLGMPTGDPLLLAASISMYKPLPASAIMIRGGRAQ
jgi:hypothetical protein